MFDAHFGSFLEILNGAYVLTRAVHNKSEENTHTHAHTHTYISRNKLCTLWIQDVKYIFEIILLLSTCSMSGWCKTIKVEQYSGQLFITEYM